MARPHNARHSSLTLVSPAGAAPSPATAPAHGASVSSRDGRRDAPCFDDDVATLAGIVPVPPHITPAMRGILERALLMRFEFAEEVDTWIASSNTRLDGAAPYERLLEGDGMAVLRALLTVPINPHCAAADIGDAHHEPDLEGPVPMRRVG